MVKRLADTVGQDGVDYVAEAYAAAYENTNLTPEEMWEECICDALGDMNIFANDKVKIAALNPLMAEIQYAAESEARGDSTTEEQNISKSGVKNEPDGKASRETYSQKEYDDYGWARDNNILSASENANLRSQFADAVSGRAKYPKTKSGEYMIAIGDKVDNKIAYMKGTIDNPVITRVLEIDVQNETRLSEIRRETYALEGRGIQQETGGIFYTYSSAVFGSSNNQQRSGIQSKRYNNQFGTKRSGSSKAASRVKEYIFETDEDNVTGKASRELDLIDYINEKANVERENMTKAQQLSKIRAELESMKVGKAELMAVQKVADALYGQYGGDASVTEFRYAMLEATKLALELK